MKKVEPACISVSDSKQSTLSSSKPNSLYTVGTPYHSVSLFTILEVSSLSMVAVERVGRYIEQIDSVDKRKRNEATLKALQRNVKSKAVSRMLQWTLTSQRQLQDVRDSPERYRENQGAVSPDWDYDRGEDDSHNRQIDETEEDYSQVRIDSSVYTGQNRQSPPLLHHATANMKGGGHDEHLKAEIVAKVTDALQQIAEPNQAGIVQKVDIAIQVHHIPVAPPALNFVHDESSHLKPWWSRCFGCGA